MVGRFRPPAWAAVLVVLIGLGGCHSATREAIEQGDTLVDSGRLDEAILAYSKAIGIDPDCSECYQKRGGAYLKRDDYQEAVADLTEAIRLDPETSSAYSQRGLVFLRQANYGKRPSPIWMRRNRLRAAQPPSFAPGRRAHLALQQYDEAIADADQAVALESQCGGLPAAPRAGLFWQGRVGACRGRFQCGDRGGLEFRLCLLESGSGPAAAWP